MSGYDVEDQEQNKCIQQYGTTATTPGQSPELDSVGPPWIWFVVAVLVIENFMAGPFAHEW